MKIIGVVGTLGAGKTTVIMATLHALVEQGVYMPSQLAYVVNDEGTIEGEVASQYATITPMVNGCFTCDDPGELIKVLKSLKSEGKTELVFLEGFGIVSGAETTKFLTQSGLDFEIIALLDVEHLDRNLGVYQNVLRSQLQSATTGIAVTRSTALTIEDRVLEPAIDLVATLAHGKEIFLASQTSGLPLSLLAQSSEKVRQHVCEHGCNHDHHVHSTIRLPGIHGMQTFSYLLRDGATLAEIQNVVAADISIIRVKGAVAGVQFGMVHSIWTQGVADSRSFIILYATRYVLANNILALCEAQLTREEVPDTESYAMLREAEHDEVKTLQLVQELLEEFPTSPRVVMQKDRVRLITHPEIVQTIVQLVRRKGVNEKHFAAIMERCVEYWLSMVDTLNNMSECVSDEGRPKHMRELGVSLAWWTYRFGHGFKPSLVDQVISVQPGLMVAQGIVTLRNINTDPTRAEWECGDYSRAIEFGITTCPESKSFLLSCFSLAVELAEGLPVHAAYVADFERLKSL